MTQRSYLCCSLLATYQKNSVYQSHDKVNIILHNINLLLELKSNTKLSSFSSVTFLTAKYTYVDMGAAILGQRSPCSACLTELADWSVEEKASLTWLTDWCVKETGCLTELNDWLVG